MTVRSVADIEACARGLGTRSDVVEMLNRTDVLLNNEQADAKTLSLLLSVNIICVYKKAEKRK